MRKADKIKLSVMVGVSLLAFVVGCVDTAVQPIPPSIDYKSDVNIVNLTQGTGVATVNMYSAVVNQDSLALNVLATKIDYSSATLNGTADMGNTVPASTYQEVSSGSKAIVVSYASIAYKDTFRLSADSQYKMRLFIVGDTSAGGRQIIKSDERYTWQTPGSTDGATLFPAGQGWVKIFNGSPDAVVSEVEIAGGSVDTTVSVSKNPSSYIEVPAGSYTLTVTTANFTVSVAFAPASKGRYTAIVYNDEANLRVKILTDD